MTMDSSRTRAHAGEWHDDVLRATARRAGRNRTLSVDEAARRTAAAVAKSDWHWPHWLDRQLRPTHAAFVPIGAVASVENVTTRTWTTVGTVASGAMGLVDPTGFVTPASGQWGIDWIVQAGDRWYVPAREAAVRQHAIDDQPVIETSMRIVDGDAIQRVYAIPGERESGDVVVVEYENASTAPIALAIAVRPADCLSVGVVDALEFDGRIMRVNEQPALILPRQPAGYANGNALDGDSVSILANGLTTTDVPARTTCIEGLANSVAIFPVAHRATLRFLLLPRAPRRAQPRPPERLPDATSVARGWRTHVEQATSISVPDGAITRAYQCALRRLLLAIDGPDMAIAYGHAWSVADEALIVSALARIGLGAHVAPLLVARMDDHRIDGWTRRGEASLARNLAALRAVVAFWRATHEVTVARSLYAPAVRMAQWCGRRIERNTDVSAARALAPLITALADMARAAGRHETGDEIDEFAATIAWHATRGEAADLEESARAAEADTGDHALTRRGIDLSSILERAAHGIAGGNLAGLTRLQTVPRHLSAAGSWPSFVHPRLGTGSGGLGDDPLVCARFAEAVRGVAVQEDANSRELRLLPIVSPDWKGQSIDVARVPTFAGALSYSVRWHGPHAAVIWELEDPDPGTVRLSAPGLSQEWSSSARSGEALLASREV
jgi:hypothetical protein